MASQSAGILLFRKSAGRIEFFIVHPGGPFFAKKQDGWWTIPKGEIISGEQPLEAALREFKEETGYLPAGDFIALTPIQQKGGKKVWGWAIEGDLDPALVVSNNFEMQWPPKSGRIQSFPEIDKASWFSYDEAKTMINERQVPFLYEVLAL